MENTHNNFYSDQTNYQFSSTKYKPPSYRTAKLFGQQPNISTTNNSNSMFDLKQGFNFALRITKYQFPKLEKVRKPVEYDPEYLKNELISRRSEFQKKKNELLLLKIKSNKLLMSNIYNKSLIAKILNITPDNYITKEQVFLKIKNCKLSPEDKLKLEQAHEILTLKLDIEHKKKSLEEKENYLTNLNKNVKRKIVSSLQNDYFIRCEQQRSLLKTLEKLEKKYNLYERKIDEISDKLKLEATVSDALIDKEVEAMDRMQRIMGERLSLMKSINQLNEKIKKQEKSNSDKDKEIKEGGKNNINDEQKLKVIKDYKSFMNDEKNKISQKTKSKEEIETLINNQSKEIKTLEEEQTKLNSIIINNREEKPKLIRKAFEPKKEIERMESLKKELTEIKQKKQETELNHTNKQKELNEIKENDNRDNKEYNKIIEGNNNIKEDLNKKIDELNSKLTQMNDNNITLINKISKIKNEFDELVKQEESIKKQIEENNLEEQENNEKIEEEKKKENNKIAKERKREIDRLKKEQNIIKSQNSNYENEIKMLQGEIDDYDKDLENYDKIEQDLNDAIAKLNNLKNQ